MIPAQIKQELIADTVKATPVAAYMVSILNGVDWPSIAALLAAIYTLILIVEKVWSVFFKPKMLQVRAPRLRYPEDE